MGLVLEKWQWNNCFLKVKAPDYGHTCAAPAALAPHRPGPAPPAPLSPQGRARASPAHLPRLPLPLRARRPSERRRRGRARPGLSRPREGSGPEQRSPPGPARPPPAAAGRGRPRAPPRALRAGNKGGGGAEGEEVPPRIEGGPGGGRERGHGCRSDRERSWYLHQDGRVVKALDLRSNGRMSAWVRTPLLAKPLRWYLWREMLELMEKLPTAVYLLTSTSAATRWMEAMALFARELRSVLEIQVFDSSRLTIMKIVRDL
ncbi:PREDICTED: translation initiation factor IF-2-like [Lepidothrix coronata]|uniref:Translation initiation factor IF-2-like n=1 Tax=Lepidothrix coronata TaxID=321398 RepID=A0A6J0H538_9PASS|nr:PREDICTED: translation initiation factor IF-2-like [Lepidothrix coronata]